LQHDGRGAWSAAEARCPYFVCSEWQPQAPRGRQGLSDLDRQATAVLRGNVQEDARWLSASDTRVPFDFTDRLRQPDFDNGLHAWSNLEWCVDNLREAPLANDPVVPRKKRVLHTAIGAQTEPRRWIHLAGYHLLNRQGEWALALAAHPDRLLAARSSRTSEQQVGSKPLERWAPRYQGNRVRRDARPCHRVPAKA
jgi:hypothetical protein